MGQNCSLHLSRNYFCPTCYLCSQSQTEAAFQWQLLFCFCFFLNISDISNIKIQKVKLQFACVSIEWSWETQFCGTHTSLVFICISVFAVQNDCYMLYCSLVNRFRFSATLGVMETELVRRHVVTRRPAGRDVHQILKGQRACKDDPQSRGKVIQLCLVCECVWLPDCMSATVPHEMMSVLFSTLGRLGLGPIINNMLKLTFFVICVVFAHNGDHWVVLTPLGFYFYKESKCN